MCKVAIFGICSHRCSRADRPARSRYGITFGLVFIATAVSVAASHALMSVPAFWQTFSARVQTKPCQKESESAHDRRSHSKKEGPAKVFIHDACDGIVHKAKWPNIVPTQIICFVDKNKIMMHEYFGRTDGDVRLNKHGHRRD